MEQLFGKAIAPYAKAWIAFLGAVLLSVAWYWPGAPTWVAIVGNVLVGAAVWAVPNAPTPAPSPDEDPYEKDELGHASSTLLTVAAVLVIIVCLVWLLTRLP